MYKKDFDFIIERAKSVLKPLRVVIAGAEAENIVKGAFMAADAGFARVILMGNGARIAEILKEQGLADKEYQIIDVEEDENVVQKAIELIKAGKADCLMRGNTQTRDFLMPILSKKNGLIRQGRLLTHIALLNLADYDRILAISDVTMLVRPNMNERIKVIQNMSNTLNALGYERPNIALLSLVETPSFHMQDTIENQTIVRKHAGRPVANCNLVGPIAYDLIIRKEAARLKNFDCDCCGEFDGIVVPNLLAGSLLVKTLQIHGHADTCGVIVGANIPIAITSRSDDPEASYLSLACCAALPESEL